MKHLGAIAILTTMMLGLGAWGGREIVALGKIVSSNGAEIQTLKSQREESLETLKEMRDDMREVRQDIKQLLQRR